MRYLDPKADLTFKKVFGEHPDLIISFLNALLPLKEGEEITEIEYLPIELVPETPLKKLSIVDVRCKDQFGRQFIVEMQMLWSRSFMQRVLFNAAKAYVRQLDSREHYELLQPVYSLNLVNEIYLPDVKEYYHLYSIVCDKHTDEVIEGLQFIFIELPKFTPQTVTEKKMAALWLRYLTEINEHTREAPADLLANPEVNKALTTIEESAYTDAQLLGYDKFWDIIRTESMFYNDAMEEGLAKGMERGLAQGMKKGLAKGMEKGLAKGMEKGIQQGIQQGLQKGKTESQKSIALNLMKMGLSDDDILKATGLTSEDLNDIRK